MGGVTYPVPQLSSRVLPGMITSSVETIPLGITGFPQLRAEEVRLVNRIIFREGNFPLFLNSSGIFRVLSLLCH